VIEVAGKEWRIGSIRAGCEGSGGNLRCRTGLFPVTGNAGATARGELPLPHGADLRTPGASWLWLLLGRSLPSLQNGLSSFFFFYKRSIFK
jgi:hypothetical protein